MKILVVIFLTCLFVVIWGPDLGATSGQMAFAWVVVILSGIVVVTAFLRALVYRPTDEQGVPADRYHPDAGQGVKVIALNSQPLPGAQFNEIMTTESNGWFPNRRTGYWERGNEYGYFDENGKFKKFAK